MLFQEVLDIFVNLLQIQKHHTDKYYHKHFYTILNTLHVPMQAQVRVPSHYAINAVKNLLCCAVTYSTNLITGIVGVSSVTLTGMGGSHFTRAFLSPSRGPVQNVCQCARLMCGLGRA